MSDPETVSNKALRILLNAKLDGYRCAVVVSDPDGKLVAVAGSHGLGTTRLLLQEGLTHHPVHGSFRERPETVISGGTIGSKPPLRYTTRIESFRKVIESPDSTLEEIQASFRALWL